MWPAPSTPEMPMLIRYGYEITINCPQPTPLVCLLAVHEERKADIRVPETVFTVPDTPTTTYLDLFGNRCRRLVAPAGDLTLWGDATIEDDGKLDPVVARRPGSAGRRTARRLPGLSDGQPLLRNRQAQPGGVGYVRQHRARLGPRPGDLRFRQQPHPVRLSAGALHAHRLRGLSTNASASAATSRIWR